MCQAPRFVLESPLRIVICEDDEQLAAVVADMLDRDGRFIVVGRASDGDEAVRLVAQRRIAEQGTHDSVHRGNDAELTRRSPD